MPACLAQHACHQIRPWRELCRAIVQLGLVSRFFEGWGLGHRYRYTRFGAVTVLVSCALVSDLDTHLLVGARWIQCTCDAMTFVDDEMPARYRFAGGASVFARGENSQKLLIHEFSFFAVSKQSIRSRSATSRWYLRVDKTDSSSTFICNSARLCQAAPAGAGTGVVVSGAQR